MGAGFWTLKMVRWVALAACAVSPLSAWAQRIVDLGPTALTIWIDLNDVGQAAGVDRVNHSVVLYSGGSVSSIWTGQFHVIGRMNNAGVVTGNTMVEGFSHAAAFASGTGLTDLGAPGSDRFAFAEAINDAGQVVGTHVGADDLIQRRAFIYSGGSMTDIGTLGGVENYAMDINASGQVAGYSHTASGNMHAYVYSNGQMTDLGPLVSATFNGAETFAAALNDRGDVVGFAQVPDTGGTQGHAFLYAGGSMHDLGTLGGTISTANDINERGQIVGYSRMAGTDAGHAFIYENGVMSDLNRYASGGWTLTQAEAINENGDILGIGTLNGESHTFLLTWSGNSGGAVPAIPEPGTFVLLAFGLAGLVVAKRRRS